MIVEEIKELIQVVSETGIAEFEVPRGDNRVRIRRANPPAVAGVLLPGGTHVGPVTHVGRRAPVRHRACDVHPALAPGGPSTPVGAADRVYIKSPIVGTYYESPSPGLPSSRLATGSRPARYCASSNR